MPCASSSPSSRGWRSPISAPSRPLPKRLWRRAPRASSASRRCIGACCAAPSARTPSRRRFSADLALERAQHPADAADQQHQAANPADRKAGAPRRWIAIVAPGVEDARQNPQEADPTAPYRRHEIAEQPERGQEDDELLEGVLVDPEDALEGGVAGRRRRIDLVAAAGARDI